MNQVNGAAPSPELFFQAISAYQRTAAVRTAIELDLFSAMGESGATAKEIAGKINASERGTRILCDYLTMAGFLTKQSERYALTPDSAMFLDRNSPAYVGGMTQFLLASHLRGAFDDLTATVRRGGAASGGTVAPEHPIWLDFARSMAPVMVPAAQALSHMIELDPARESKVLDISASHGMWGISIAKRYPRCRITAVDWAPVLEVTREAASRLGVSDRFHTIAGSAFEVELGTDYDLVLVPNFLHHFKPDDCVRFLKKAHAALRPDGQVVIIEFVPNPDRVSPPQSAGFSLVMLATTPEGDAYTFAEFEQMLGQAGFQSAKAYSLPPVATAIIAETRRGSAEFL
jgi:ubiquinone/menaquinone biosynthesis C-methylase UbiE